MPLNPNSLSRLIEAELNSAFGGSGEALKNYKKLADAIARAVVQYLVQALKDSQGNTHF